MNNEKKTLICDIDDVLWDMFPTWCELYNIIAKINYVELTKRHVSFDDFKSWDITTVLNEHDSKIFYNILNDDAFWDKVVANQDKQIISISNSYLEWLKQYYNVYIATSTRYYQSHKIALFLKLFPSIKENEIILIQNKWLLNADIVIDDRAETLYEFDKKRVRCVKINKPWNYWFNCEGYANFILAAKKLLEEKGE